MCYGTVECPYTTDPFPLDLSVWVSIIGVWALLLLDFHESRKCKDNFKLTSNNYVKHCLICII